MMKLIVAILHDTNGEPALQALTEAGFRATRVSSTGGFLRRGNSTLLIGTEAEQVPTALGILREHSAPAMDPGLKRATIFVLKVDRFEQI
jgi:uncharacterized protein YaaQ